MTVIPRTGRVLALDWGEVRFGVARSDEAQILATPLTTLLRRPGKRFPMPKLLELVERESPAGLVVGLPISLEGEETPSSAAARELADAVARRTSLPVHLFDERFTTAIALDAIREMGGNTRGRREDVDAMAAAVLLQHFLDSRRSEAP